MEVGVAVVGTLAGAGGVVHPLLPRLTRSMPLPTKVSVQPTRRLRRPLTGLPQGWIQLRRRMRPMDKLTWIRKCLVKP